MDELYFTSELETEIYGKVPPYEKEGPALLRYWCKKHNAYYYGRPKDSFSKQEAIELATNAGCTKVLLDNLS